MEVHYTCIWASSLVWNLKIDAIESVHASVFCVCKRERLVWDSGPEFVPPPLRRQTDITVLYRNAVLPQLHLCFPPCWFLPCVWRFIFWSNFPPPPQQKIPFYLWFSPRFVFSFVWGGHFLVRPPPPPKKKLPFHHMFSVSSWITVQSEQAQSHLLSCLAAQCQQYIFLV